MCPRKDEAYGDRERRHVAPKAGRSGPDAVRERKLFRAARRHDRGARERLVVSHLGLVRAVASRYRNLGLPFDDLVQEGALGLLNAIDRYDPCRGTDFESFARFRVRRAIRNALTEQARLVRLPKQVVERRRMLARTQARLTSESGRTPTPAELAAATGLSPLSILEARTAAIAATSLDAPVARDGSTLANLIADSTAADPEGAALSAEEARLVRDAVARLAPRSREIVSRHFGLDGGETAVAAVALDLHLSERRTRTIERDALHELASELRSTQMPAHVA
jgi:RNA polymerase sigma factor (sigma-70 family)